MQGDRLPERAMAGEGEGVKERLSQIWGLGKGVRVGRTGFPFRVPSSLVRCCGRHLRRRTRFLSLPPLHSPCDLECRSAFLSLSFLGSSWGC